MASRDMIVIGGSTGGIDALQRICANLPADLPATVFVVVHVGQQGRNLLADILDLCGPLRASTAVHGETFERGRIYVAPADRHLMVVGDTIQLGHGPRENMTRPAVDPLFRSAAVSYGPRVIGVVLTGLLNDGAAGLAAVKQCGGVAVVQNPADAVADQMPWGALGGCDVDYRAPVAEMGALLAKLAGTPAGPPVPVPAGLSLEVEIALGRPADTPTLLTIADPSTFSCPSCSGVLSELRGKPSLRFRCQIGHAFTAETLDQKHTEGAEAALGVALRIIEERSALMERMAADARAHARNRNAAVYEERGKEYRQHGEAIRQTLLRLKG